MTYTLFLARWVRQLSWNCSQKRVE